LSFHQQQQQQQQQHSAHASVLPCHDWLHLAVCIGTLMHCVDLHHWWVQQQQQQEHFQQLMLITTGEQHLTSTSASLHTPPPACLRLSRLVHFVTGAASSALSSS
jgi:hypothetical protein